MAELYNHLYTLYILGTNRDLNWSVYSVDDKESVISKGARKEICFVVKDLVIRDGEKENYIFIADDPSWLSSSFIGLREFSLHKILSDPDLLLELKEMLASAGCKLKISVSD